MSSSDYYLFQLSPNTVRKWNVLPDEVPGVWHAHRRRGAAAPGARVRIVESKAGSNRPQTGGGSSSGITIGCIAARAAEVRV